MEFTPLVWDETRFEVGQSYHVTCTGHGVWLFVTEEGRATEFSIIMLQNLRVRFANHVQRLGDISILMEHIIINDVCCDRRSVNFVVIETSPQVVFAVKLMPLDPHAP